MSRYVQDASAAPELAPTRGTCAATGWDRARGEAREAMTRAVAALHGDAVGKRGTGARAGSELARRLEAAAESLTYGRDLLHTHIVRGPDGGRQFRSEWGAVLTSPPVRRALLAEMGSLAHQLSWLEEGLERSPRARGSPEERRRIKAACHWLQNMHASVCIADRQEAVSAADREMLWAVPVNARPARRLPEGREPVSALCAGVIETAERVRHAAWLSGLEPAWSPRVTVNSLRQVAAASTITSHHCAIVLHSLAEGVEDGDERLRGALVQAADAATRARSRWLVVAHALDQITTDTQDYLSQAAVGGNDLALWTGRLAYADPSCTLASKRAVRSAGGLVHESEDLTAVSHAVHRAFESMALVAQADRKQVRAAAKARRILVAAAPASDPWDVALPFAQAPPEKIGAILGLYRYVATACSEATGRTRDASAVGPVPTRLGMYGRDSAALHQRGSRVESKVAGHVVAKSSNVGAIEQTLCALGVTDVRLLRRGAEIDRTGEQLIIDATAAESDSRQVGSVRATEIGVIGDDLSERHGRDLVPER